MPDLEGYRRLIRHAVADLTEQLAAGGDRDSLLETVTTTAVELIRGAEFADVMLIDGERLHSIAPTEAFITALDEVQIQFGQGPCLEAAVDDAVVRAPDLATETRWPEFCRTALAVGVRSALTYQLHTPGYGAGALNVYGCAAGSFNVEDEAIGATLAALASVILTDREVIGRATGVLMERFRIGSVRALEMLHERSVGTNRSIQSVASDIAIAEPGGGGGI